MAKERRKLQHIHSSILDKQPTPSSIEVGEIAINNAENKEFLSIKNTNNKVVRISSDGQMIDWMEKKTVIPYSGVVDNINLTTNRSNIEIKLNQVVASNTVKHDVVNGAKDIDGNLINPTTDSGITNGAGFAIDMSAYALTGSNPSFSSVTVDNNATIKGNLNISGTTTLNSLSASSFSASSITTANGLGKKLTWSLGTPSANTTGYNGSLDADIVIPSKISNLTNDLANLTITTGSTSVQSPYNGSSAKTITIPSSVTHLTEYDSTNNLLDLSDKNVSVSSLDVASSGNATINSNLVVNGSISADSVSADTLVANDMVMSTNGFYQTSDIRKKKNIQNASFHKAVNANTLPIKQFNYIDDSSERIVYGIIAQEAENYGLDEIVYTDENGNKSVDYTSLTMLKLAYLENENKLLRNALSEINKKLDELNK